MAAGVSDSGSPFRNAINAQTDMEKLNSCRVDFRSLGICVESWSKHRQLPQLFVTTVRVKNQSISIYVNENVIGAYLVLKLVIMNIITDEDALWSYLETSDGKTKFELHDPLGKQLNDIDVTIKQRASVTPNLTIFVKTLSGETYEIQSSSSETICMFKCRIEFKYGSPMDQQRLIFQGKELTDKCTLVEYGISDRSILHRVLKLRGGKPVIRLRSTTGRSISNVNVHLYLNNVWKISCIYPESSNTDRASFVQWNNIEVYSDGCLMMKETPKANSNLLSHHYASIDDELEYRMLFWEALTTDDSSFTTDNGLCVPRIDFPRILNYLLKNMLFSSEDRDDMITYILPHLDEMDPNHIHQHIAFRFLSPNEYSSLAELNVRPEPDQIIRAFLLYRFTNDEQITISTMDELENEVKEILGSSNIHQSSGLIVHEWGSMFIQ